MILTHLVFYSFFDGASSQGGAPVVVTDVIRNFSLREWRSWHRPEDKEYLKRIGEEAADVIAEVAERQAKDTHLDEQQRLEELQGEMRLRGLEMRSQHLKALNDERERLINAEIAQLISIGRDNEDLLILMAIV